MTSVLTSVHRGLNSPWPQPSGFNPPWPQSPWPQSPWTQSPWPQSAGHPFVLVPNLRWVPKIATKSLPLQSMGVYEFQATGNSRSKGGGNWGKMYSVHVMKSLECERIGRWHRSKTNSSYSSTMCLRRRGLIFGGDVSSTSCWQ